MQVRGFVSLVYSLALVGPQARELNDILSPGSVIFGVDDARYVNATEPWNTVATPHIQLVIQPGEEADVSTIVSYCNENSVPFLARNRAHGGASSLNAFTGIQIDLSPFSGITIDSFGTSARFGGGVYGGQVVSYLWDRGYVTPTGAYDCVSVMGPGLGGAHGRLGGLYGMISDNILQLNVVLGKGTAITVSSTSHPDLFWAMRGAGHNFGIVTSFESKIYPRGPETWHYHNYVWAGEHLEVLFRALNALHRNWFGSTPVNMAQNWDMVFAYRGPVEEAAPLLAPFDAIPALFEESGDLPYPGIAATQGLDSERVYNVTAERRIFESFRRRIGSNRALARGGVIEHDGYSSAGVEAFDPYNSAYPFRSDRHLLLINIGIAPDNTDSELEREAWEWAGEVRDLWNEGQPGRKAHAYVNYANGFEPVEEKYGHEAWRLERLRALKERYEPDNRIRFYNPIVQS
ncbi:FAD-binding oxidoreductase [Aspergillus foveolatus]|uniref:FAD-binding oxidoreductase n=1 Tax=Aspergillus foveolatus TaxID=210207 RepID=UPI003CCE4BE4